MFDTYLKLLDKLGGAQGVDFDATAFVALAKDLPLFLALAMTVAGLITCLLGGRPVVLRLIMTPVAALVAFALAPRAAGFVHLAPKMASYVAAGLAGLAAAVWPPIVLFVAFGALGATIGGELAGEADYWLGFIPGFLLGGVVAIVVNRIVAVIVSSLIGAALFVLGLLGLSTYTPLGPMLFGAPVLSLGLTGCVAIAAMAFQFKFTPNEEEAAQRRADKVKDKELKVEDKARAKRFKKYDKQANKG